MLELEQLFCDGFLLNKKVEEDFYLLHRSHLRFFDDENVVLELFSFELTDWNRHV